MSALPTPTSRSPRTRQAQGRVPSTDADRARIGVGSDLEIVFQLAACSNEDHIDTWVDPRVAHTVKMRRAAPRLGPAEIIHRLVLRRDLSLRFRLRARARKIDMRLTSGAVKDREPSTTT